MNRRLFLSASAAALAGCSSGGTNFAPHALPAAPFYTRLEVAEFSRDAALVGAFRDGVRAMMAIQDPRDVRSWYYWHHVHHMSKGMPPAAYAAVWNQCKHHRVPYFYAWHRGFVYFFEKTIRAMSGNQRFALPYWDYYRHPEIPAIFAEPQLPDGTPNPLYWRDRTGQRITGLNFASYGAKTFPNSRIYSFEVLLEINPHGHVHDQVGGDMGHIPTAALDPIFYAHHCNVDRLWSAWVDAGAGRHMPAAGSAYYDRSFAYDLSQSWSLGVAAMVDTIPLGYTFRDLGLPVAPAGAALPARPAVVAALGTLGLEPVSIEVPLENPASWSAGPELVLRGVELTPLGARGGFAIRIYAGLPQSAPPVAEDSRYSVGEAGPFGISAAQMAGMGGSPSEAVDLRYPLPPQAPGATTVTVSFVASGAPSGVPPGAALLRIGGIFATA